MKIGKRFCILVSSLVLLLIAGCGGGATNTTTADSTPPSIPKDLSIASSSSNGQINVSWAASTDNVGVTGYKVYKNGAYFKTISATTYSDTEVDPSTQYCYTITALDQAGNESSQSTQSCATTPQNFRFMGALLAGWHFGIGQWTEAMSYDLILTGKSIGINVYHFYPPYFESQLGVYSETELFKMDYFLDVAAQKGVYIMPSFINAFATALQPTNPYYNPGGVEGLIKDSTLKQAFKNRIKMLINRRNTINGKIYKDDPTILGWMICDEPISAFFNYPVRPPNVTLPELTAWVEEMGVYIKSLDPNHLVTMHSHAAIDQLQGDWLDLFNTPSLDFLLAEDADMRILENPPADWPLRLFTLKKPVIIELSLTGGGLGLDQAALCNDYTLQSQLFQTAIPACFAVKADGVSIFEWGTDLLSPASYDSCYYYTISNAPIRDVLQAAAIGLNALNYPMPPLHFVTIGQFSGKKYFLFAP